MSPSLTQLTLNLLLVAYIPSQYAKLPLARHYPSSSRRRYKNIVIITLQSPLGEIDECRVILYISNNVLCRVLYPRHTHHQSAKCAQPHLRLFSLACGCDGAEILYSAVPRGMTMARPGDLGITTGSPSETSSGLLLFPRAFMAKLYDASRSRQLVHRSTRDTILRECST